MSSLEDYRLSITSGSSADSSDDSFLKRPANHDSFFKEKTVGNGTSFSVLINEKSMQEVDNESSHISESTSDDPFKNNPGNKLHSFQDQPLETDKENKEKVTNIRKPADFSHITQVNTSLSVNTVGANTFSSLNSSKETVNTDVILSRKRQSAETPIVDSRDCRSPNIPQFTHSGKDLFDNQQMDLSYEQRKRLSQRTISTSVLLEKNALNEESADTNLHTFHPEHPYRSSSCYLKDNNVSEDLDDITNVVNSPKIERAAKLLRMQVQEKASLTATSLSGTQSTAKHPTSLLSSILVKPQVSPKKNEIPTTEPAIFIPALRKLSGSSISNTNNDSFEPMQTSKNLNFSKPAHPDGRYLVKKDYINDRDDDDVLDLIFSTREKINRNKDFEMNMPIQIVDDVSISSKGSLISTVKGTLDFLSIPKILLLLTICILIPPLFFFVGLGTFPGFDDERLLLFLLQSEYRHKLITGFIWAIDLTWLRRIFLAIGLIQLLALFACICIGFGVGLT